MHIRELPGDLDQYVCQNKIYFSAQHRLKIIGHGLICGFKVTKIATKQASRFGVLYISGMEIHICLWGISLLQLVRVYCQVLFCTN